MLCLRSGRAFEDYKLTLPTDGWSLTVWDLINTGLNKAFNRKNSGRTNIPRTAGGPLQLFDGMCFTETSTRSSTSTVSEILGSDKSARLFRPSSEEPPQERYPNDNILESDGGVSFVLIETSESRNEE